MNSKSKKMLSVLLIFAMIFTLAAPASALDMSKADSLLLTTHKEYSIAPGITEEHITTVMKDTGKTQVQAYIATVDPKQDGVGFLAGYKNYDTTGAWGMQTLRDQAKAAENATGQNVVFGINADYFNMGNGCPSGALVMGGTVVHEQGNEFYFAFLRDGTVELRNPGTPFNDTGDPNKDVIEAVGSPFKLIENGNIVVGDDGSRMPTGAVGLTADGKVVFMTADGRQEPKSCGYTMTELSQMLLSYGVVDAIYFDGGGSATFASKREGETELTVKNSPSDGNERKVSSCLFVTSAAKPTGIFDHAVLEPRQEVYTPGSTVEFSAIGSDSVGTRTALPDGVKFALKDSEMGTINADDGTFVSSGKIGLVDVDLTLNGAVVGSTQIEIADPDEITFATEEITLGFNQLSTLGLMAKSKNRSINFKDGDFDWSITNDAYANDAQYVFKKDGQSHMVGYLQGYTLKYYEKDEAGKVGNILDELSAEDKALFNQQNQLTEDKYIVDKTYTITKDDVVKDVVITRDGDYQLRYYSIEGANTYLLGALSEDDIKLFGEQAMGSFDGNTFLSSEDNSVSGMLTCAYKGNKDVHGSIHAIIGQAPIVAYDFEDYITDGTERYIVDNGTEEGEERIAEAGQVISAADYWTPDQVKPGHPTADLGTMNYSRGGQVSSEIVDIASGEPVRKGNHALKLNYDFTQCSKDKGTEGANVGPNGLNVTIPGQPTAIGMYVYAPEGTANYWLRVELKDGNGTIVRSDFTRECNVAKGQYGGFDWTGWKYVEADLTGKKGPFTFNGKNMVRLMYVPGQGSGDYDSKGNPIPASERKGSIYVDNIQFVYGANPIDIDSPTFDSISANNAELKDGAVINSNVVDFSATVSDVANKYTTGVDYSTANVWVDGVNLTNDGNLFTDESKNTIQFNNQLLSNGTHEIKFLIRDKEGNETTETRVFTVNGEENIPVISAALASDSVHLNERAVINLTSSNIDATEDLTAQIKFASGFSDYVVKYADSFEETKAPAFDEKTNTLTLSVRKKADAKPDSDLIASVGVLVPNEISEGTRFSFSVPSAVYNIKTETEAKTFSYYCTARYADVKSYYKLTFDELMAGFDAIFTITDENGNRARNVTLKTADGEVLGQTDNRGVVTVSTLREPQTLSIYVEDDQGKRSFVTPIRVFALGADTEGRPSFIKLGDVSDSQTSKNITWTANPGSAEKKAIAQFALKKDYEAKGEKAFKAVEGTSKLVKFDAEADANDNKVLYANSVVLTGLKADTEYVYRVGDGKIWSDVYTVKTLYNGADTNFFIIGDTQADNMDNINSILNLLSNGDTEYSFGVQTGDFVDAPKRYNQWVNILNAFGTDFFKTIDMIHVIGNHEQMGDPDADISQAMFNVKDAQHYSVTYGNVYVAVLGYVSGEAKAKEDAQWLISDASRSDAKWKIVVSHQPPYGTNETTEDCENFHKYLSQACDTAEIDFFFSGHDHAYARTKPIKNYQAADDGTVYFVCGSTGEKAYPATNEKHNYPFAVFGNNNYDGLYLTVSATSDKFTIQAHDENGKVIDEYSKTKAGCGNLHSFVLTDDNHLICAECGMARRTNGFTGLVKDKALKLNKYLINGSAVKNEWRANGDDYYYFGEDGVAVSGTVKINGVEYTFDKNGKFLRGSFVDKEVTNPDNGKSKVITVYYGAGGELGRRWQVIDGEYYCFYSPLSRPYNYGEMYKGGRKKVTTANKNTERYFTFADDGRLLVGAFETDKDENGNIIVGKTRYYWGDDYVKTTTKADGVTYEFDEDGYIKNKDINSCKFSTVQSSFVFTGKAIKPGVTVTCNGETLKAGTDGNYTVTYSNNVNAGTATMTVAGNPERGFVGTKTFTFKIYHDLTKATITVPSQVTYTGKNLTPSITVKSGTATLKAGTDYTLTFKNNKNPGKATVTIAAKGNNVKGKVEKTFRIRIAAPTGVKATQKTKETTVNIKWNKVDPATGYRIFRSENGKDFTKIATVKNNVFTYNDKSTKVGKTYTYKVYATYTNSEGQSPYSATTSVKVVAPSAVKTVKVASNASSVTLTITKVSDAAGYEIYRATSKNGKYTLVKTQTGTSFKDTNVKSGSQYYYKVRAYKLNGKTKTYGAYSAIISAVTAPVAVKKLAAKGASKAITVSYSAVSGASGYEIYRATSKNGKYTLVKITTGTSFKNTGLKSGAQYFYKVRAYKLNGKTKVYGAYSSVISAATAPDAVKKVTAKASGKNVTVKFNAASGATGYTVYRSNKKDGTYKAVATVTKTSYTNKNLKAGTYYYAVRPYKEVSGVKVYSPLKDAAKVSVKVK
ncbi:MAG: phosphodiester glycosidase family protein [Ruminococcus sp.]|nr:phosphodiester glycosidase family protein [Ruminococcus sp.]